MGSFGLSLVANAETAAAGKPAGHKVPMHPSTLTVRSSEHPQRLRRSHHYARDTFNPPTPIHGTMAGPRM